MSKPSAEELNVSENVCTLIPNRWNPRASAYANCEQSMLDWEGNMAEKPDSIKINLDDIQHDEGMASSMMISSTETRYMVTLVREDVIMDIHSK
eukprot:7864357-Ditylum_brightwellii.AAC.1